ncbi:MAG: biopolymer transporter ExbD [Planctomycetota bacterium]|nr:MAG: biopolymer transporter ExbD [Planctomycetota bacterium]
MATALEDPPAEEIEVEEPFYRPRPPGTDDELDITPMIDITFLLLIFFLVSSKMNAEQAVDLPKARHGGVVAGKESVIILMKRGTGDQAEVLRADGSPFAADLDQQNAEIAEYVTLGLDAGKKHVLVKAEGSVRRGEVQRVSEAISEALEEGQVIHFAVLEQG